VSQENVEIVRRAFARLVERVGSVGPEEIEAQLNDAVLEEFYDPDVEWVPVPQGLLAGRSYVGYEGIRRFWADFVSTWDEYVAEPEEFLDIANDQVVVIMRVRARMHELAIDEVWSAIWTLRNRRIVRSQAFTSQDGALQAAGLRE
jgi:ketosteroid isomerase-like protein